MYKRFPALYKKHNTCVYIRFVFDMYALNVLVCITTTDTNTRTHA